MPRVVTISASYGAHGDQIANGVAERLGLPFVDRAIPASVVKQLTPSGEVEESLDEPAPRRWERIIMGFANATTPMGPNQLPTAEIETPERFRKANEAKLRDIAETTGGVILGRAGMAVLGDRRDVLCVRLDGPVEERIAQAMAHGRTRQAPGETSAPWTGHAMRIRVSSSTSARTISACTTSSWTAPRCR